MSYVIMIIAAVFVNNIVLAQFLGICPFLGVSKKVSTAGWMGLAVMFVMLIATLVTYPIYHGLLKPEEGSWLFEVYGTNASGSPVTFEFMQTIVYILVIAALVQMVEIILKKSMPSLYSALGVFLPLITTNCTILGVAISVITKEYTLAESIVYAIATAAGFILAMVLFAGIREQLEITNTPKAMKGTPLALVTAGLLAMAFMGFSGVDKGIEKGQSPEVAEAPAAAVVEAETAATAPCATETACAGCQEGEACCGNCSEGETPVEEAASEVVEIQ